MQDSKIGVYPRVCGGTERKSYGGSALGGLSPRVRGNLTHRGSPSVAMEISDSFAGRSALALSFVPIRRGDHARCTQEFDGR